MYAPDILNYLLTYNLLSWKIISSDIPMKLAVFQEKLFPSNIAFPSLSLHLENILIAYQINVSYPL